MKEFSKSWDLFESILRTFIEGWEGGVTDDELNQLKKLHDLEQKTTEECVKNNISPLTFVMFHAVCLERGLKVIKRMAERRWAQEEKYEG